MSPNFHDQDSFETTLDKYYHHTSLMLIDNNIPATSFMMIYAWSRRRTCEYVTFAEACQYAMEFIIFGSEKDAEHIRQIRVRIDALKTKANCMVVMNKI